jgi:hypothetical protein
MLPTYHEKIKIFHSEPPPRYEIARWLENFQRVVRGRDEEEVKALLLELVPEYIGTAGTPARVAAQLTRAHA